MCIWAFSFHYRRKKSGYNDERLDLFCLFAINSNYNVRGIHLMELRRNICFECNDIPFIDEHNMLYITVHS